MNVVVAGGTGFIGSHLVRRLLSGGHHVAVLSRSARAGTAGTRALQWDGRSDGPWSDEVAAADAVVNLSGASIGDGRWTAERKRVLISSRVDPTSAIVAAFGRNPSKKRVLVNASATGYYGLRGDEVLDESSAPGDGFLAHVSAAWEAAAREAEGLSRLVILRFGVVLSWDGGALPQMLLPFRLFAGGPVGSGRQWMSWVAQSDAVRMIEWAIENGEARGAYNVTAPEPVRNADFARAAGRALHRPSFVPTPSFALRLLLGEMADELLLGGQRVVPARALAAGFTFDFQSLEQVLVSRP